MAFFEGLQIQIPQILNKRCHKKEDGLFAHPLAQILTKLVSKVLLFGMN